MATGVNCSTLAVPDEPMTPHGTARHPLAADPAAKSSPVPHPPNPPDTPVGGRIVAETFPQPAFPCFMCNRSFGNQDRFMLVHACRAHAGDIISLSAQARLTASGRGICRTENCDAFRKHTETYCRKFKLYAPVRSFRDGDRVPSCSARPGPSQAEDAQVQRILSGDSEPSPVQNIYIYIYIYIR